MSVNSYFPLVAAVFSSFICVPALAQDSIVTDRPDAAESSRTVGAARVQIETGFDATFADPLTAYAFPTKLRVGVLESFELHLESDVVGISTLETPVGDESSTDVAPLDVGGKVHLFDNAGFPSLGILAAVTVPLDESHVWGFTTLLAADFDLTDIIGIGTNVGVSVPFEDSGLVTGLYAVALGVGLPPVPELGLFVETFGGVNEDAFSLLVDGGATYLITPNLQVDAYVRTGLVNDETSLGLGGGVSARF